MPKLEKWFHSVETDRPFETCVVCEGLLRFTADSWVVNKHYHRKECILEYAVCEECRDRVSGNFSDASKSAIRQFLENEINWEARMLEWMAMEHTEERLDSCVACRTPRDQAEGFTLSAQFRHDGSLVESALPLLMCSRCINQITDTLSPASRKVWQDFIADHFPGPDSEGVDLGFF